MGGTNRRPVRLAQAERGADIAAFAACTRTRKSVAWLVHNTLPSLSIRIAAGIAMSRNGPPFGVKFWLEVVAADDLEPGIGNEGDVPVATVLEPLQLFHGIMAHRDEL